MINDKKEENKTKSRECNISVDCYINANKTKQNKTKFRIIIIKRERK